MFKDMSSAPLNGKSVLLKTSSGEVMQASYHSGKWCEEKEWSDWELTQPDRDILPTGWAQLES